MSLGALVLHRERTRDKQRKWIGAQKRASLLRFAAEEEAASGGLQETMPMMQTQASVAQDGGKRDRRVTWE